MEAIINAICYGAIAYYAATFLIGVFVKDDEDSIFAENNEESVETEL